MTSRKSPQILNALRKAAIDEKRAVEFVEWQRWGEEPACPRCGDTDVYMMKGKDGSRNKDFRWRCRECKKMFTVRTNTIFEESRLSMSVWLYSFWKACIWKKGISALQLSDEMEITHKSALSVLRRIQHCLGTEAPHKLQGATEIDESHVGGLPRHTGIS